MGIYGKQLFETFFACAMMSNDGTELDREVKEYFFNKFWDEFCLIDNKKGYAKK